MCHVYVRRARVGGDGRRTRSRKRSTGVIRHTYVHGLSLSWPRAAVGSDDGPRNVG